MRAALAILLLSGCTTIGHVAPPADWPELEVIVHNVPHATMRNVCAKYAHWTMSPEACAEFFFGRGECHLWFSADFPPSRGILEHEYLHCEGYDHVGQSTLVDLWRRYKATRL